jgi:CPA1 family monovalent cation:H+ antiporter
MIGSEVEVVLMLLAAVLALAALAQRLLLPYPIMLVIGGLLLAAIPGLPVVPLEPDLVFVVFLPPILWAAAYFTSQRDFKANLRPITLLGFGAVAATTAVVAVVARMVQPGMSWPVAVALGAIVAPPDAAAATALARRFGMPRRIVTVLEGESLVNDAGALVLYRAAVMAVTTGAFSLGRAFGQFVFAGVLGVAIGIGVAWLASKALEIVDDNLIDIAVTFLAPYIAWITADRAGASAVLACVAGGLFLRPRFSRIVSPTARIEGRAAWELVVFLINGVLFILIGLQLRVLSEAVLSRGFGRVIALGLAVSLTVIVSRVVWVFAAAHIPRWLSASLRVRDPVPGPQYIFVIAWVGMRGIVSLAAALALPRVTAAGTPFPYRAEIILTTFMVILATLVVQGLSLAPLLRRLHLQDDDTLVREEAMAREHAATVALARLDALANKGWVEPTQLERLRVHYANRVRRLAKPEVAAEECSPDQAAAYLRLRRESIDAERRALLQLRDKGLVGDEIAHRLEHELDVEAIRVGIGDLRLPWSTTHEQPVAVNT